jgi:thiamine-phosphate pyrophosphorylase
MLPLAERRLYGIVDLGYLPADVESVAESTRTMLAGGIDILQLRAKGADESTIAEIGRAIIPMARAAEVPLIINDYPQLAADLDADGVHLGQDDGEINAARAIVGPGKIVGRSTHSPVQARAARDEGADYIGFGPLFATPTKPGRPAIGVDDIAAVHEELGADFPIYCIGGIKLENAHEVLAAGARRLVIVSGILQANDIPAYIAAVKASFPI